MRMWAKRELRIAKVKEVSNNTHRDGLVKREEREIIKKKRHNKRKILFINPKLQP